MKTWYCLYLINSLPHSSFFLQVRLQDWRACGLTSFHSKVKGWVVVCGQSPILAWILAGFWASSRQLFTSFCVPDCPDCLPASRSNCRTERGGTWNPAEQKYQYFSSLQPPRHWKFSVLCIKMWWSVYYLSMLLPLPQSHIYEVFLPIKLIKSHFTGHRCHEKRKFSNKTLSPPSLQWNYCTVQLDSSSQE